jgi:hypothetical protein
LGGGTDPGLVGPLPAQQQDYEYYAASSESMLKLSMIHHMLRRLRPKKDNPNPPFKYPKERRTAQSSLILPG